MRILIETSFGYDEEVDPKENPIGAIAAVLDQFSQMDPGDQISITRIE